MMLKRCKECGGTVAITKSADTYNHMRWIIIGHGMQPCPCGGLVKMESAVCMTRKEAEAAYDQLVERWNRERGMPDAGDHD